MIISKEEGGNPARRLPLQAYRAPHGAQLGPQIPKKTATPCPSIGPIGEGGIRTHGTVTRTTVFEFYDSYVGPCRSVAKRVLPFAFPKPIIPACDAQCRSVPRSWFAIWFANDQHWTSELWRCSECGQHRQDESYLGWRRLRAS